MTTGLNSYLCVRDGEHALAIHTSYVTGLEADTPLDRIPSLAGALGLSGAGATHATERKRVLRFETNGRTMHVRVDAIEQVAEVPASLVLALPDVVLRHRPGLSGLLHVDARARLVVHVPRVCADAPEVTR